MGVKNHQDYAMSFDQLGLGVELCKAAAARGYTAPTSIQTRAIPVILAGRDILARAQTGTGKTDAFALPLVEILSRRNDNPRHPRALVLTPTRELALQVGESIKAYARTVSLRCTVVYGGGRIQPQIDRLKRGTDVLVATPGRLLDLAGHGRVKLARIEFLVFDEADRMLDLGFSREISEILDFVPDQRRTMLFSATYTQQIRHLAAKILQAPEHIEATPLKTAAESVAQTIHLVERSNKRTLLTHLIKKGPRTRILVFARTKHGAIKLAEKLAASGINAAVLHGNMSQSLRIRTLQGFKNGEIHTLVATDVAARGLDIGSLPYVVNYDIPGIPEDYVHRIGRTGRAGETGIAVSLVSPDEKRHLQAIEKLLNQRIPVEEIDGHTVGSDVPDFVLLRPDNPSSQKRADRAIKEIVVKRSSAKLRSRSRKVKPAGSPKNSGTESKSRPRKKNNPAAKKAARTGSRPSRPFQRRKPKAR